MKKLLTIVLSLVMVMSMTAVSFADEEYTDVETVTLTKSYNATNEGTTSPAETFTFEVIEEEVTNAGVLVGEIPDLTITGAVFKAGAATGTATATITLPDYDGVGEYVYTLQEVPGTTAGVTYSTNPIELKVIVIQQGSELVRIPTVTGDKSLGVANVYSAGSLTVGKTVAGNLGDQQKPFTVKVTFTAPEGKTVSEAITYGDKTIAAGWTGTTEEIEITLKHGESVTFTNIPYDVTYTVVENDYTDDGYKASYNFVADTENDSADEEEKLIDDAADRVQITNTKGITVDTGIILDNGLYIVLLAGVAVAAGMFFMKRRQDDYDM